jgi:UDP-N-acetylglucosamine 1-carboxyvinyltransferase
VKVRNNSAIIKVKTTLSGTSVMSTDLRASVSLVMAAMIAEGESEVLRVYHLDRGYETLEDKLNAVGTNITRLVE